MFPQTRGVGYDTIGALVQGDVPSRVIIGILAAKATIWSVSLGSGTSGGVLAPLLMMGGALGGIEAWVLVMKRSILTEKIARRGCHLSREYATDPPEILFVREVMRTAADEGARPQQSMRGATPATPTCTSSNADRPDVWSARSRSKIC